ncbi:ZU5 domain-containing protein [Nannocystis exedens]|uniref:ZU5 domain-containing protein n=1 Tax=Nannocystis exedens TaxID=54 RepID=A0A1I2AUZ4_9BACT|nr:hypothetical protein [Nannocystis exedens]PCC74273.1 hypothetical protein NAEX_07362 [Nannocystis exedens]SFE47408.1 ZU5 domain-containing protein [Nannocystis exedens]
MPLTHRFTLLASLCFVVAGCTDPGATTAGSASDTDLTTSSTGSSTTVDSPTTTTGGDTPGSGTATTLDTTGSDTATTLDTTGVDTTTAGQECPPVSEAFGPAGGELTLCGATLRVPAGAVAEDVVFGIEVIEPPAEPPFEQEFASPVFRFTPDDLAFDQPVELILPRPVTDHRISLARHVPEDEAFWIVEACDVTDTTIAQSFYQLGTFVTLRGTYKYPDSTSGLGGGTLELELLGKTASFPIDMGGFGIYADAEDGSRTVTLKSVREVDGAFESLRVDFAVDGSGDVASLVAVEWLSTVDGGYTYIVDLIGSDGFITLTDSTGDHYAGELGATVHGGNPPHDEQLHATFDVTVEKYTFPPELSCFGGGG